MSFRTGRTSFRKRVWTGSTGSRVYELPVKDSGVFCVFQPPDAPPYPRVRDASALKTSRDFSGRGFARTTNATDALVVRAQTVFDRSTS